MQFMLGAGCVDTPSQTHGDRTRDLQLGRAASLCLSSGTLNTIGLEALVSLLCIVSAPKNMEVRLSRRIAEGSHHTEGEELDKPGRMHAVGMFDKGEDRRSD